jgi:hypothetical protein
MRVALEQGESLEVAILENNRVVGTLSLEMRAAGGSAQAARPAASASASASAPQQKRAASSSGKRGRRGGKRNISPEARQKMAEAQRRRWEKFRSGKK